MQSAFYRTARRLLKSNGDAQDVVQEVVVKMWTNRKQITHYDNLETYGLRIVRNKCLDLLRSSRYRNTESNHDLEIATDLSPHKKLDDTEQIKLIDAILEKLPVDEQMIIELRSLEQKSITEIAEIVGITENNVRVKLSRTRKKIKEQFDKQLNYGTED